MNEFIGIILMLIVFVIAQLDRNARATYYRKGLNDIKDLDSREFEFFCADYLKHNGFTKVKVSPATNDGGKDIIAYLVDVKYVVECKKYDSGKIGRPILQKIHSVGITEEAIPMVMTTGEYTSTALKFSQDHGIVLMPNEMLVDYYMGNLATT